MAKKARAADRPVPIGIRAHLARRGITSNVITQSVIAALRAAERLVDQVGSQPLRDPIAYPDEIDAELRRFMGVPSVPVVVESVHHTQARCAK
jgi:hypothetical protein